MTRTPRRAPLRVAAVVAVLALTACGSQVDPQTMARLNGQPGVAVGADGVPVSTDGGVVGDSAGDTGTGAARTALMRVRAADPLPDVPDLTEVWVAPRTDEESAAQLAALEHAEGQLTGYRTALFARIDAAGLELIRRYRADPTLALSVLA